MLEIILVRHGKTDWNVGRRVMGRRPIPLNQVGRQEATRITMALTGISIDAIYTSPIRRALETARIIARGRSLRVGHAEELSEIDYGEWVGRTFDEISFEPAYQIYHKTPKKLQPPGGEKIIAVQKRAVRFVEKLKKKHKKGRVIVVSHADVIKTILLHYLRMDLNDLLRIRIDNGSLSVLSFSNGRHRATAVNCPPDERHPL